jgi:hypothetical protein
MTPSSPHAGLSLHVGSTCRRFREVVALVVAYNEADIIAHSLRKLTDQGIGIYLLDNWSTDDTLAEAKRALGDGLIGHEAFPADGPSCPFDYEGLLRRQEQLHHELGADWYVRQDVDEIRDSPWVGVSLREGIRRVDRGGFNCVDHRILVFPPTDNAFVPGSDMEAHFRYCEPEAIAGNVLQQKTWKNVGQDVNLRAKAGHAAEFPGKWVFPIPFLLRHYPIRSQEHGRRKVLRERVPRYAPQECARGLHVQYAGVSETTCFIRNSDELALYDEVAVKTAHRARFPAA